MQAFVASLLERGDVYLGTFEGWYDDGQEEYHTETSARVLDFKSPISGKPLVRAKENNYYFKLSAYQERLENLFETHPEFCTTKRAKKRSAWSTSRGFARRTD